MLPPTLHAGIAVGYCPFVCRLETACDVQKSKLFCISKQLNAMSLQLTNSQYLSSVAHETSPVPRKCRWVDHSVYAIAIRHSLAGEEDAIIDPVCWDAGSSHPFCFRFWEQKGQRTMPLAVSPERIPRDLNIAVACLTVEFSHFMRLWPGGRANLGIKGSTAACATVLQKRDHHEPTQKRHAA